MAFWNKKKSQISVSEILRDKSGQDALIEIDNLLSEIFYKKPKVLTDEEKVIVMILEYEREINNGGFNQFYFNLSGNYYNDIVNALEKVKSIKFIDFLKKSSTPFPDSIIPGNRNKRQEILEKIEDDAEELWGNLEQEFFKYEENIYELLINYIRENIEHFR
ncbi:MAG: DMP19 family protein [bacterium]|nr:DMP19 family protein [bacterium]